MSSCSMKILPSQEKKSLYTFWEDPAWQWGYMRSRYCKSMEGNNALEHFRHYVNLNVKSILSMI